jgi:hypothetical protein
MLYTWPPTNSFMRGIDFMTAPERGDATRRALRSTQPVASPPLQLVASGASGIVLFRAVGEPGLPPVGMLALVLDAHAFVEQAVKHSGFGGFELSLADVTRRQAACAGGRHPAAGQRADYRVGWRSAAAAMRCAFRRRRPTWKSSAAWSAGPC